MSFEQTFKNIDDILRLEVPTALDYTEQSSWILFLRYLDELEQDKADEAELKGEDYTCILDEEYRWSSWAMPKSGDGKLDHHTALTGPDLVQFVDDKLFPYLASFRDETDNPNTIEYKVGEIFYEIKNKIRSGYNLREILEAADELPFRTSQDKHELSALYEEKIKDMGNAGRNGGEYYTPRPLIRAMIKVVDPKIGEKVYDGAAGSSGFLCESHDYLYDKMDKTTDNLNVLQTKTLYGKEKKNLAYVIGVMNMILHGIEAPNLIHTNTLGENTRDIQEKDRYNVILANPPFGGKERKEVQQNFDIKTGETAFLFLQHFIKSLKNGGRAAIIIKNTFLSNADNAAISLRKHLLESCNVHTILDLPVGTFTGVGQKTIALFFEKGEPTKDIWAYELKVGRSLGKKDPLNDRDFEDFLSKKDSRSQSDNSWIFNISDINTDNYDLTLSNPNNVVEVDNASPTEILEEVKSLFSELDGELEEEEFNNEMSFIEGLDKTKWKRTTLDDTCEFYNGKAHEKDIDKDGKFVVVNSKFISSDGTVKKFTKEQIFPLHKNDVVLVMSDVPNGKALAKCFLVDENDTYSLNQRICAIRSSVFHPKFLYYQLNRNKFFLDFNNGENQTNLRKGDILNCPLLLPPMNEQEKIVESLDLLSEGSNKQIEMINANVKQLKRLKNRSLREPFLID